MDIYPIQYKHCTKCSITKSIENFSKDSYRKDGIRIICKACCSEIRKQYNTKPQVIEKRKQYQRTIKNKETQRLYEKNNRDKINKRRKHRRDTDPLYRLSENIRAMIRKTLSRNKQSFLTTDVLGCSFDDFKIYIENQFAEGMTWDNRSEWHIDHIIPISFAKTENEVVLLNHYTNLRPLWANDNIIKSNNVTEDTLNHPIYKFLIETRKNG